MNTRTFLCAQNAVRAEVYTFCSTQGTSELHVMLHIVNTKRSFHESLLLITQAYDELWKVDELSAFKPLFRRFFLSDPANQSALLEAQIATDNTCATAWVGQPPLDGTKIALWVLAVDSNTATTQPASCGATETVWPHNGLTHVWHANYHTEGEDSATQTDTILKSYVSDLERHQMTLAGNFQRTCFFVHDVDIHYAGVVKARKDYFIQHGLTPETHYIASTGIQGNGAQPHDLVRLDSYAIKGLCPEQVTYLYARTHLNPTYEYGVTFERGVKISYADRAHLFISGTASINNQGEVVHIGDIVKQTQRMWDNVDALLKEGNSSFDDVAHMLVYLRDTADYDVVKRMFEERFPHTPKVFLLAPVCRPQWLVEMECIAISKECHDVFPSY